jgi:RsiW-degrading membrane proteinase PrsW (M82 family)
MAGEVLFLVLIVGVAFVPSIWYMVRLRNLERYNRNSWLTVIYAFTWGAVAAVILTLLITIVYGARIDQFRPTGVSSDLFQVVVMAPLIEESAKALGVLPLVFAARWEEEDGLVLGAASGLGFAATENLLYEWNALLNGTVLSWALLALLRSLTSTVLHASATSMSGWGLSKWRLEVERRRWVGLFVGLFVFLAFWLVAVAMHAFFNLFASLGTIYTGSEAAGFLVSLLLVIVFAGAVYRFVRQKIQELDRRGPNYRSARRPA